MQRRAPEPREESYLDDEGALLHGLSLDDDEIIGLDDAPSRLDDPAELLPGRSRHVAVAVIGAGPAGLAAATAAAQTLGSQGGAVLLVEAALEPGGSYLSDPRFGRPAAFSAPA